MPRAAHGVADDEPLAERPRVVRAGGAGGEDLARRAAPASRPRHPRVRPAACPRRARPPRPRPTSPAPIPSAHHPCLHSPLVDLRATIRRYVTPSLVEAFGKYQLVRRLGAGGMAEVFLAREPLAQGLAKILVIKKIHPSLAETPEFRRMFEDEAKVAVNLNHPNIVQTFGYGQIGPHLLPRHGARRGRRSSAHPQRRRRGRRAHPLRPVRLPRPAGGQGARLRAPQDRRVRRGARHRAPRRLAAEHPGLVGRDGQARRLRHRARAPRQGRGRRRQRQVRVHVARAGGGRARRSAQRHLRHRDRAVGADLRALAVRQPEGQAGAQRDQERAGAAAARARPVDPRGARGDHRQGAGEARPRIAIRRRAICTARSGSSSSRCRRRRARSSSRARWRRWSRR